MTSMNPDHRTTLLAFDHMILGTRYIVLVLWIQLDVLCMTEMA